MNGDLPPPSGGALERGVLWSKWIVLALLSYWAVFAVVAPVMNYDSEVYNLARLYIADAGGLFGNHGWNTERQAIFPWTFDAIHYVFLPLHRGYCLPSFACLIGLLVIVYRLVAASSERQAWWCCLALLSMPTLVFQAVCTKNDLGVVFGVACWYYTWRLWREEPRGIYLLFMAMALGFAAGAKTTGVPFLGVLGAFTLWQLRGNRPAAVRFAGWMAVSIVLLGSVEIYLNNALLYHSALGPPAFIQQNKNHDGLAGGVANFIRYCFGNMNVGVDAANPASPVAGWLENACRDFLRFVGLGGDLGYRSGFGEVDANMRFLKLGFDAASDFGPVGALALVASLFFVFSRPWTDLIWRLAASGLATLALTSYTVAWMLWNARFLLLPFTLFSLALTLWISRRRDRRGGFLQSAFFCLLVYSAVIYPLHSYNKKPADLWRALKHREAYETSEFPAMLEIVQDLHARAPAIGPATVLLHAGINSWTFCLFELSAPHLLPAPVLDQPLLAAASTRHDGQAGTLPVYVVTVDVPPDAPVAPQLTLLKQYSGTNCALYQWQPPTAPAVP